MVIISGIDVDFPFEPYECQKTYMEKVIACIQHGQNGVLESPTGTGKTLCLLCATLAWRETFAAKLQFDHINGINGENKIAKSIFSENLNKKLGQSIGENETTQVDSSIPKIVYASRTHSQISQVISELKNTRYKPTVCVLGSREQMCINSEVQKEENNNGKVHMCRVKVSNKQCFYYNNLERNKSELTPAIRDIEDLVAVGKEKQFCPYYMSREIGKQADITFMPYNYILDFKARGADSLDLANSIVILDEGHNVETVCEDNMSFDFTSFDLASCIDDCQQCVEILMRRDEEGLTGDEADVKCELTTEDVCLMKALFLKLESIISDVELDKNESATKNPSFLLQELSQLNVNAVSRDQIVETIESMSAMLAASSSKFVKIKNYALDKFSKILKTLFSKEEDSQLLQRTTQKFYKVHIQAENVLDKDKQKKLDVWAQRTRTSSSKEKPRTLSYWCFNPGLTMREVMLQGVRSLILTSGTLSPLSSFKQELSVPFNVELENSHVIDKHQIFVGIVSQGPDGKRLNSSYQYRSSPEYQLSLGNTIINMSRIIPNGLLVFFPSYSVMDMVIAKWRDCGIWDRLASNKGLFVEPRRKGLLNETMTQYYDKIKDPNFKGALFFAVCRGKVSEGLDFADSNGRAVIITGLPFPPSQDPKIILKKQFLDEQKGPGTLSGKDWYRQQASRAVNQAIGRVIRHKSDYGAILLCDERFNYPDAKNHLPQWIKQQIRNYKDFGSAQRDLVMFFKNIQQKMGITESVNESKRKLDSIYDDEKEDDTCTKSGKLIPKFEKPRLKISKPSRTCSSYETNSVATSSLARLNSIPAKKSSLFESLKENESGPSEDDRFGPSLSTSILDEKQDDNNITSFQPKSKKYKIVKTSSSNFLFGKEKELCNSNKEIFQTTEKDSDLGNHPINSKDGTSSTDTHKVVLSSKEEERNEKIIKATRYVKTLKSELTPEKYVKFSESLNLYKRSKNLNVLCLQFESIFDKYDPHHMNLMKDFIIFIKEKDKDQFKEFAEKLGNSTIF